jgi:hypothetical protein
MNVLDLLKARSIEPAKASNSRGGEYHSECPGCGGKDRFHVWPEQNEGAGSYWCRQCGKAGDAIQFLIDFDGCTFPEACRRLGRDQKLVTARPFTPPETSRPGKAWKPRTYEDPAGLWREKAEKFVLWCHGNLLKNEEKLAWLHNRGIPREAVERFKLGWNIGEKGKDMFRPRASWGVPEKYKDGRKVKLPIPVGLVIPVLDDEGKIIRVRIRRDPPYDDKYRKKYHHMPGSSSAPLVLGWEREAFVLTESELDAMAVFHAAGDLVGSVSMGSSSTRPDAETAEVLSSALVILDALDYDGAGAKEREFWETNFPQTDRWPVPAGKDPGEAFAAGVDLRAWILEGLPPRWRVGRSRLAHAAAPEDERTQDSREKALVSEQKVWHPPAPSPETESPPPIDAPASLFELCQLMRHYPVWIVTESRRLAIEKNQKWADRNWDLFGRISQELFSDYELQSFICSLPNGKYNGARLLSIYFGEEKAAVNE